MWLYHRRNGHFSNIKNQLPHDFAGKGVLNVLDDGVLKIKGFHTRYWALGPEMIPVYRKSARRWLYVIHPPAGCHCIPPGLRLLSQLQRITAAPPFGLYSFYHPVDGRRLSRPGRWSPTKVIFGILRAMTLLPLQLVVNWPLFTIYLYIWFKVEMHKPC